MRWSREAGFVHQKVDDGENRPGRYKATPILLPDGAFHVQKISRLFQDNSRDIDERIANFIYCKLLEYPAWNLFARRDAHRLRSFLSLLLKERNLRPFLQPVKGRLNDAVAVEIDLSPVVGHDEPVAVEGE